MANLRRYWDLSVDERAALTVEQVEALTRVELMEHGVLVPTPPVVLPVEPPPIEKLSLLCAEVTGRYGSQPIPVGFRTAEEYRAFLALRPVFFENDYTVGLDVGQELSMATPSRGATIALRHHAEERRSLLERCRENTKANAEEERRFATECANSEKALAGLWQDYREIRMQAARLERVRAVFADYLAMSGGDRAVARRFLAKAFEPDLIDQALGPVEPVVMAADAR